MRALPARGIVQEEIKLTWTNVHSLPTKTCAGMRAIAAPVKPVKNNAVLHLTVVVGAAAYVSSAGAPSKSDREIRQIRIQLIEVDIEFIVTW